MRSLLAAVLLAAPLLARAQDCDVRVLDRAGALRDAPRVEAALVARRAQGVDAHVVTLPDLGAARDLDDAIARIGEGCASWQSGGQRKPDILVMAVSFAERHSGLYHGAALDGRLPAISIDCARKSWAPTFARVAPTSRSSRWPRRRHGS